MEQKSLNQIVQSIINNIHDTMPDADTKVGTFLRDVIIDPISDEFAAIYGNLKLMELHQSILTANDTDLDKLAANYFITRKKATNSYGKMRFYISNSDVNALPTEILIPKGTIISTIGTLTKPPIQVQILDSFYANKEKIKTLPIDSNYPYFYFIELAAMSISTGSVNNIGSGELVQQINNVNQSIAFVKNPFPFTGGTDYEDDASLALRINLAISGANIGTKNGYLSYILKQNGIMDAKIIGAGEYLMRRDGGKLDNQNKYIKGKGGMVDIYVRGEQKEELTYTKEINSYYIDSQNPDPYADIILPVQPVLRVSNINVMSNSDLTSMVNLINAADFEVEKRNVEDGKKYYKDILWDFSITDRFQDEVYDYYVNSSQTGLPTKSAVDKELNQKLQIMSNMNYGINWSLMTVDSISNSDIFKSYFYTDNKVYMIKSTTLGGLICVKKDDKMYIRIYGDPDYELIKDDITFNGNSVQATDRIRWIKKESWKLGEGDSKLQVGSSLIITYYVNELIKNLQDGIDQKRVLTADVLVKQANELPVEVIINANCFSTSSPEKVKPAIINKITNYIDTLKKLGGEFDLSDIVSITKQIEGVDSVDLDGDNKPQIRVIPYESRSKITAKDNEYFKVQSIVVNVVKTDIIN